MTAVWITRACPGAERTAGQVRAMGLEPVVAPLLAVQALATGAIDLGGVGALAFTSANGVVAFAARSPTRDLPVFAVGAATAAAARAAGFAAVRAADGDVETLATAIAKCRWAFGGVVLHPAAAEPAGDLIGALGGLGVAGRVLPIYESAPTALAPELLAMIPRFDAVLLHSPKAARVLAEILSDHPAPRLIAVCLSQAVAAPVTESGLARIAGRAFAERGSAANLACKHGGNRRGAA